MKNRSAANNEHERACLRVAARFRERWLRIYVRTKLRSDPIFPAALQLLRESSEPLIDLGCGVGLLPFYLRERNFRAPIIAIDSDRRKIKRAREVARASYRDIELLEGNVTDPIDRDGNVVLVDLLHYLSPNEQKRLLQRLERRVVQHGMLIIRDCPLDRNWRFWLTHFGERFAQMITWNVSGTLHYPTREEICAPFSPDEFVSTIEPLWGRTPLNNYIFIFRRRLSATVPARAGRSDILRSLGRRA